jgi:rRNA-processing protein EBP2
VKQEIKREIAFYNTARDNVMQGMRFLIQSKVPIARPDDFLAEMLKTDQHMIDIKQRLLKQQTKIKTFEENKTKQENKKLHKALKDFKMRAKHSEKRENMKNIEKLKKKIQQKGGDQLADNEFDNIMSSKKHES